MLYKARTAEGSPVGLVGWTAGTPKSASDIRSGQAKQGRNRYPATTDVVAWLGITRTLRERKKIGFISCGLEDGEIHHRMSI